MKIEHFTAERVKYIPRDMEPGVLYVSDEYQTAKHLCACGCGSKVVTPLGPGFWTVRYDRGVSLSPSIGNWSYPCKSHYWISHGEVDWARVWNKERIEAGRLHDQQLRDELYAQPARRKVLAGLRERVRGWLRAVRAKWENSMRSK